jgi:hypothetical protein
MSVRIVPAMVFVLLLKCLAGGERRVEIKGWTGGKGRCAPDMTTNCSFAVKLPLFHSLLYRPHPCFIPFCTEGTLGRAVQKGMKMGNVFRWAKRREGKHSHKHTHRTISRSLSFSFSQRLSLFSSLSLSYTLKKLKIKILKKQRDSSRY